MDQQVEAAMDRLMADANLIDIARPGAYDDLDLVRAEVEQLRAALQWVYDYFEEDAGQRFDGDPGFDNMITVARQVREHLEAHVAPGGE